MEGTPGSSSGSNFTFQPHTFQHTNPATEQARKKPQQPRQLLSCTVCRERKVKCDRTKPCSACCARGRPKDCHFVVADGADYGPIQQSYELRKLRQENVRLKERLRASRLPFSDDDDDLSMSSPDAAGSSRASSRLSAKAASLRQKRFRMHDPPDSLYFGSPGTSTVINEFSDLHVGSRSLSHTMPHGPDMYVTHEGQPYPFATMWPAYPEACIPALLECLPPRDLIYAYLDAFQRRAQSCSFPHTPDEVTRKEIDRFLSDAKKHTEMFPDMLALVFAVLAQGVQHGVFDRSGGAWVEGAVERESSTGDVYIAAAMQALRMASFMNRPTLLGLQTLIMIGPYLTNSGRFLDAWTLFGTTIRLAHSMGLHRNPKYLDPVPPLRECTVRQSLWWWMLHMDQQYSMIMGRPLGISGIGDCPPPEALTTNTTVLRLGGFINHFTVIARQILSSDRLSNVRIDKFTDELRALWDTMPESLQFDETWLNSGKQIPEWPLDAMAASFFGKLHNYLILLNRQRLFESVSSTPHSTRSTPTTTPTTPHPSVYGSNFSPINVTATTSASTPTFTSFPADTAKPPRGRPLVISSSLSLLSAFLYTYHRVPAALIDWTMGQQAFNAAMLLLLDALETGNMQHIWRIEQAYAVFVELERRGVHKLAGPAVARVSWGLEIMRRREHEREGAPMMHTADPAAAAATSSAAPLSGKGKEPQRSPLRTTAAEAPNDTVMGNTGMFLLEDPGLQSFAPESFAPLGWDMVGADLSAVKTAPALQPFQPLQPPQQAMPPGHPIHAAPPLPGLVFHHHQPQPQPPPQHPPGMPFGRGEAASSGGMLPGAVNVGGPPVEWPARGGHAFGHGHAAGGGAGSGFGHGHARGHGHGQGRKRGRGH